MDLRKRLWASLAPTALAAMALIGWASVAGAVCSGDVNGGGLDITDVGDLLQCVGTRLSPAADPNPAVCDHLCGGSSLATGVLSCGDLNLDGQISTADAILALNETGPISKNIVPICTSPGATVPCGTVIDATDPTNINSNRVLAGCEYFVKGTVFVQPGVVLTIRPGALIKGVSGAPTVSALVFLPQANCFAPATNTTFTARINAAGTPTLPIIFTSDQPIGSRRSGDWGGVAFNGCSRVNDMGGVSEAEGLVNVQFGGGTTCSSATPPGTAKCEETSGLMRYVRIEFAGNELSPDNELNSLTQNGLGSSTSFTFVQSHMGLDDNFEWFGGTIHDKHFVSTGARDDNWDWQLGSDIKVQYGVSAQYLPNLDALGDNGFEGDNNERGFNNTAISTPQFCNITAIGAKGQPFPVPTGGSWFGALLRRGTAGRIAKSIVYNWIQGGFQLRDPESAQHACVGVCNTGAGGTPPARTDGVTACTNATPFTLASTTAKTCATGANVGQTCVNDAGCPGSTCGFNNLLIRNSIFYDNGPTHHDHAINKSGGNNTGSQCNSSEWLALLQADPTLRVSANSSFPDATIDPGIQAGPFWPPISFQPTNAANVKDDPTDMVTPGFDCGVGFSSFFDSTKYMGGIDPNGTDWTQTPGGWISFVTQ